MLFWGLKTDAFLDVWSIEHFISGIAIGALVSCHTVKVLKDLPKPYRYRYHIYKVLFIAFFWECIEHYLELGLLGKDVETWFQGVEHWTNRLISDPILVGLGYWFIQKLPKFILPARIFSTIWLFLHIFVFPHSMYLHQFI